MNRIRLTNLSTSQTLSSDQLRHIRGGAYIYDDSAPKFPAHPSLTWPSEIPIWKKPAPSKVVCRYVKDGRGRWRLKCWVNGVPFIR